MVVAVVFDIPVLEVVFLDPFAKMNFFVVDLSLLMLIIPGFLITAPLLMLF